MLANLDMLIRRTGRHPLPVEIIRNIVNKVSVTGFYTLEGQNLLVSMVKNYEIAQSVHSTLVEKFTPLNQINNCLLVNFQHIFDSKLKSLITLHCETQHYSLDIALSQSKKQSDMN